jgi:hypothetical protein
VLDARWRAGRELRAPLDAQPAPARAARLADLAERVEHADERLAVLLRRWATAHTGTVEPRGV